MKTKILLPFFSFVIFACSTHQEIKPYQAQEETSASGDETDNSSHKSINLDGLATEDENEDENEEASNDEPAEPVKLVEKKAGTNSEKKSMAPAPKVKAEKPAPPKKKAVKTDSSSDRATAATTGKNGFHVFSKDCEMRNKPSQNGAPVGMVNQGKKLWLDAHDTKWYKAYKKSGTAYVPANCVD